MNEKPFLLQMVDQTPQAVAKPGVTTSMARASMQDECGWCYHGIVGFCHSQLVDLKETEIDDRGNVTLTGQREVLNVLVNGMESDEGRVPLPVNCPLVDRGNVFTNSSQVIK